MSPRLSRHRAPTPIFLVAIFWYALGAVSTLLLVYLAVVLSIR